MKYINRAWLLIQAPIIALTLAGFVCFYLWKDVIDGQHDDDFWLYF